MRLSTPHCGPLAQLVRASGYNRLISMKHIYKKIMDTNIIGTITELKCYLVPIEECGSTEKRLRIVPPKNGQIKNICFVKDYIAKEVISSR